jgi:large subunit ribosomal protein L18
VRLKYSNSASKKLVMRLKKKVRIRKKLNGSAVSPRLSVYKSLNHVYAQLIDDDSGKTLGAVSSLKLDTKGKKGMDVAALVGSEIAKVAKTLKLEKVVFDRNGFIYHGKIKAIADAARENGLKF